MKVPLMYEIIIKQGTVTNKLEHPRTNWAPEDNFTGNKSLWYIYEDLFPILIGSYNSRWLLTFCKYGIRNISRQRALGQFYHPNMQTKNFILHKNS